MQNASPTITDWAGNAEGFTNIADCIEELTGYTAKEMLAEPGITLTPKTYEQLSSIQCYRYRCSLIGQLVTGALALGEGDRRLMVDLAQRLTA